MIKNIIFDIGNVILNFNIKEVLQKFTSNKIEQKFILKNIINSPEWLGNALIDTGYISRENAIEIVKDRTNHCNDKLIVDFWKNYNDFAKVNTKVLNLIQKLKDNNYKTIVATSSNRDRVDKILAQAKITEFFDDSICGDEVTKGKPNPEVFLKSCQKLGVNVDEAIVLEDSEAGIQASYDANIKVICIPDMKYPEKQYEEKTFKILKDLTEVTAYLKSL